MEATKEHIMCMSKNIFGNMRFAVCSGPPERPTQTANLGGTLHYLVFWTWAWGDQ